jgi:hypothetical protein
MNQSKLIAGGRSGGSYGSRNSYQQQPTYTSQYTYQTTAQPSDPYGTAYVQPQQYGGYQTYQ